MAFYYKVCRMINGVPHSLWASGPACHQYPFGQDVWPWPGPAFAYRQILAVPYHHRLLCDNNQHVRIILCEGDLYPDAPTQRAVLSSTWSDITVVKAFWNSGDFSPFIETADLGQGVVYLARVRAIRALTKEDYVQG